MIIPKYKDFSVEKIWPMIWEILELLKFFPNYNENQLEDRKYIFQIHVTTRFKIVRNKMMNARK